LHPPLNVGKEFAPRIALGHLLPELEVSSQITSRISLASSLQESSNDSDDRHSDGDPVEATTTHTRT